MSEFEFSSTGFDNQNKRARLLLIDKDAVVSRNKSRRIGRAKYNWQIMALSLRKRSVECSQKAYNEEKISILDVFALRSAKNVSKRFSFIHSKSEVLKITSLIVNPIGNLCYQPQTNNIKSVILNTSRTIIHSFDFSATLAEVSNNFVRSINYLFSHTKYIPDKITNPEFAESVSIDELQLRGNVKIREIVAPLMSFPQEKFILALDNNWQLGQISMSAVNQVDIFSCISKIPSSIPTFDPIFSMKHHSAISKKPNSSKSKVSEIVFDLTDLACELTYAQRQIAYKITPQVAKSIIFQEDILMDEFSKPICDVAFHIAQDPKQTLSLDFLENNLHKNLLAFSLQFLGFPAVFRTSFDLEMKKAEENLQSFLYSQQNATESK